MTTLIPYLRQAFLISCVTLVLSIVLESIFPQMISQTISFDRLLLIVMLTGVCWGIMNRIQLKP